MGKPRTLSGRSCPRSTCAWGPREVDWLVLVHAIVNSRRAEALRAVN